MVRGRDEPLAVFEPWPDASPPEWRTRYRAAFMMVEHDPVAAAALFEELAAPCVGDPVPGAVAKRIRSHLIKN
jgi:adenylate cyclase